MLSVLGHTLGLDTLTPQSRTRPTAATSSVTVLILYTLDKPLNITLIKTKVPSSEPEDLPFWIYSTGSGP